MKEYIIFLLGADNFEICKFIREKALDLGDIYGIYEDCQYISIKFDEYDQRNKDTMSEYESFERFLNDYDKEIRAFINGDIGEFEIKEDL